MGRRHLQVIERDGHSKRHVMSADDYEELAEKLAEKTGVRVNARDLLPDGGGEE